MRKYWVGLPHSFVNTGVLLWFYFYNCKINLHDIFLIFGGKCFDSRRFLLKGLYFLALGWPKECIFSWNLRQEMSLLLNFLLVWCSHIFWVEWWHLTWLIFQVKLKLSKVLKYLFNIFLNFHIFQYYQIKSDSFWKGNMSSIEKWFLYSFIFN